VTPRVHVDVLEKRSLVSAGRVWGSKLTDNSGKLYVMKIHSMVAELSLDRHDIANSCVCVTVRCSVSNRQGIRHTGTTLCDSINNTGNLLQVYEGLIPVYTSGVYSVCGGTRQFTVNVAGERQRRGLQLRGDILLKCYHRYYNPVPTGSPTSRAAAAVDRPQRELIFACQFHTCAVTDYTLSFTRQELDFACSGQYTY
jgi:hypothetical protein